MNRQNLPKGTLKPKSPQYSLTKDEIEELRVAFQLFDTKQEGLIDAKELKTTLESLGIQEKNRMVYNVIDSIPSGKLNFDQFLDMVASRISNTNQEEDIYQVFSTLSNGTDYITIENLQRIISDLGEPISSFEIREMIHRADVDGDNRVSFQEFYKILTMTSFE